MEALWLTPPKKFRTQPSASKVMATVVWDSKGIILIDYKPAGTSITGEYYVNVIKHSDPSIPGLVTIVLNTYFIDMMLSWLWFYRLPGFVWNVRKSIGYWWVRVKQLRVAIKKKKENEGES